MSAQCRAGAGDELGDAANRAAIAAEVEKKTNRDSIKRRRRRDKNNDCFNGAPIDGTAAEAALARAGLAKPYGLTMAQGERGAYVATLLTLIDAGHNSTEEIPLHAHKDDSGTKKARSYVSTT